MQEGGIVREQKVLGMSVFALGGNPSYIASQPVTTAHSQYNQPVVTYARSMAVDARILFKSGTAMVS
jgi:hypothetical protein